MVNYPTNIDTWTNVTDDESIISAAHMNDAHNQIIAIEQEQIDFRSRFQAYRSGSNQSIAASANVTVQFNAEEYDEKGEYSHDSTYKFIPQEAGYYFIHAHVTWWNAVNSKIYALYLFEGANYIQQDLLTLNTNQSFVQSLNGIFYFAAAAEIKAVVWTSNGAGGSIDDLLRRTMFCGHRIS